MARLSGARGSIYLKDSASKLADSYLWEYEGMQDVADASIKGEPWKRYVADQGHGRVRVQSFVSTVNASAVSSALTTNLVSNLGVGTPVDFILEQVNVSNVSGQVVTGQGYITRSQLHVARDGIITDEIEIEVDGQPTVN